MAAVGSLASRSSPQVESRNHIQRKPGAVNQYYACLDPLRDPLRKAPPDCRMLVRRGHALPYLAELKEAVLAARDKHLPSSLMGEAVGYALNRWEEIERCFEDGRLELDNNLVENAVRPVKLGLKNYLFFGSAEAGATSALFYTLLGNCKALGIDYERYLEVVLERVTSKTTPEEAALLTPAKLADEIRAEQPVPSGGAAVAIAVRAA